MDRKIVNEGPRNKKLKEISGKFIEAMLKNKKHLENQDLDEISNKLNNVFKQKFSEYQLEKLLNILDNDILCKRYSYKKITDTNYIKEIFDSYTIESQEKFLQEIKDAEKNFLSEIDEVNEKIKETKNKIEILKQDNSNFEKDYKNIINWK